MQKCLGDIQKRNVNIVQYCHVQAYLMHTIFYCTNQSRKKCTNFFGFYSEHGQYDQQCKRDE